MDTYYLGRGCCYESGEEMSWIGAYFTTGIMISIVSIAFADVDPLVAFLVIPLWPLCILDGLIWMYKK